MIEPPESDISPDFPFTRHKVNILGSDMSYVDTNPDQIDVHKPTALFLHGNPTSSYLWRNIIPHVSPVTRCIAPDLIGMGHSGKPAHLRYHFTDHYTFVATFIEAVIPKGPIVLVVHDWGSALGLHWAHQQAEQSNYLKPDRVAGIVMMEFLRPIPSWDVFATRSERAENVFKSLRTPEKGQHMIYEENFFVETLLLTGIKRKLTEKEHDAYREPFREKAHRKPTLAWPNQIPIEQKPSDVYDIVTRYCEWLPTTEFPKLLFYATPGTFLSPDQAKDLGESFKNTTSAHVGEGSHFLQEDHPRKIGSEIHAWLRDKFQLE